MYTVHTVYSNGFKLKGVYEYFFHAEGLHECSWKPDEKIVQDTSAGQVKFKFLFTAWRAETGWPFPDRGCLYENEKQTSLYKVEKKIEISTTDEGYDEMKKKGPAADSKLPPTFSPGPARPPFRIPEFRYVSVSDPDPI